MEKEYSDIVIDENVEVISKYDPEMRFRKLSGLSLKLVFAMTIVLSIFHIYTAGFGVLQEWRHRAFHLAFVLPLVFMFYSIRKPGTGQTKHMIHDILYALIGTSLLSAMLTEILELSTQATLLTAVLAFVFIIYFKRRELLGDRLAVLIDFPVFSLMVAGLGYVVVYGVRIVDFGLAFKDLNASLLFWSIFLFATFLALVSLFVIQWLYAAGKLIRRQHVNYMHDHVPYFDVFCAILACIVSLYIFIS